MLYENIASRDGWILNFVGISNIILSPSSAPLQLKLSKLQKIVNIIHILSKIRSNKPSIYAATQISQILCIFIGIF